MTDKDVLTELVRKQQQMEQALISQDAQAIDEHLGQWEPSADLYRLGNRAVLEVELPGFDLNGVRLEIESGILVVQGERKRPAADHHIRTERHRGNFRRAFSLPPHLDHSAIEVSMENGLLRIVLPDASSSEDDTSP